MICLSFTLGLCLNPGERSTSIAASLLSRSENLRQATASFGQCVLAIDMEMTADAWRSGIGLASADADRVVPLRDDRIAVLRHHAQITRLQIEMNLLACAGVEMNALKSTQSDARRSFDLRELEIELHDLVSRNLAGIGHRHISAEGLSGGNSRSRYAQIAVAEFRVAEPVAERDKAACR